MLAAEVAFAGMDFNKEMNKTGVFRKMNNYGICRRLFPSEKCYF
jgi:hypothetical protein